MGNHEISQLFGRIANLMEIKGENRFKVLAYQRASESIKTITQDLSQLSQEELVELPGIGQALAEKIVEFSQTGELAFLNKLEGEVPPSLIDLLDVPDLGPKKAALFWKSLGITTLSELESAARHEKLRGLPGMGEKSEARILAGIEAMGAGKKRYPVNEAEAIAEEWKERISQREGVQRLEIAGSLRRMRATIGDLDLVGSARSQADVMDFFVSQADVADVLSRGDLKSSVRLKNGVQIQLWMQPIDRFGSLLQFVTGSKEHNVRLREYALKQGLSLSERGFVGKDLNEILCEDEERVYSTLGMPYIAPELREDRGEVEAAIKGKLPNLITRGDLNADLHVHSRWSDGGSTLKSLADAAQDMGLSMIAFTDHSASAPTEDPGNRLTEDKIPERSAEIASLRDQWKGKLQILDGLEVDILPDGQLDFADEILKRFDLVIASIHLENGQPPEQITRRLLSAIENPHVDIIGHPSGRERPHSEGVELDWPRIFSAAKDHGKALEINSNPLHLDLDDIRARRAAEAGVLICVNSDAHSADWLDQIKYGIGTARRAWLTPEIVINTWKPARIINWLKERRIISKAR